MKNVVLPEIKDRSLAFYLAMEEFVAREFEAETFFLWRVAPTVIIGRNQDLEAEVNLEYCRKNGVEVVRRKSGGGCVYSDRGNIMISYVSRRGDVSEVFERYLNALTDCLRSIGIDAEKSGRNDILTGGRKISGNAFHMLPDRSIVHGTLLFSSDFDALEQAIRPPVEKLTRHGIRSVRQRVANLSGYLGDDWSIERVKQHLVEYFCEDEIRLDHDDVRNILELEKQYEPHNYGR
jgi:lipoic acid synthetase/lipoate-protein ligase A